MVQSVKNHQEKTQIQVKPNATSKGKFTKKHTSSQWGMNVKPWKINILNLPIWKGKWSEPNLHDTAPAANLQGCNRLTFKE